MNKKKIVFICAAICILLITFAVVYRMGVHDEKKQQVAVSEQQGQQKQEVQKSPVKKKLSASEKEKLQKNTIVYVCQFENPKTRLYDLYTVIHKRNDCPGMKNDTPDGKKIDYRKVDYWTLTHMYIQPRKFTFCPECWSKEEIESLEDE